MKKTTFEILFGKLLVLCFGLMWLMVVFKAFNLSFMQDLSWGTIFLPAVFFTLASITYVVTLYAFIKWYKIKPPTLSKDAENYIKRLGHLDRKRPPLTITNAKKALLLFISSIIAYLITQIWF